METRELLMGSPSQSFSWHRRTEGINKMCFECLNVDTGFVWLWFRYLIINPCFLLPGFKPAQAGTSWPLRSIAWFTVRFMPMSTLAIWMIFLTMCIAKCTMIVLIMGWVFTKKNIVFPKRFQHVSQNVPNVPNYIFPIFGEPVLRDIGTKRISLPLTRFYLPLKPVLNTASVGSLDDNEYCHMSTRYKASHIKLMMWWVAKRTTEAASQFTAEPCPGLVTTNYPHVHVFRIPLMSIFVFLCT